MHLSVTLLIRDPDPRASQPACCMQKKMHQLAAAHAELSLRCPQVDRVKTGPQLLDLTTPAGSPGQVCRRHCFATSKALCLHLLDSLRFTGYSMTLSCSCTQQRCHPLICRAHGQQSHPLHVQVKQEPKFMDLTASSDISQAMDVDAQPEAPAQDEPEQTSPAPGSISAAKRYA